jgi:hypothetical protein
MNHIDAHDYSDALSYRFDIKFLVSNVGIFPLCIAVGGTENIELSRVLALKRSQTIKAILCDPLKLPKLKLEACSEYSCSSKMRPI